MKIVETCKIVEIFSSRTNNQVRIILITKLIHTCNQVSIPITPVTIPATLMSIPVTPVTIPATPMSIPVTPMSIIDGVLTNQPTCIM